MQCNTSHQMASLASELYKIQFRPYPPRAVDAFGAYGASTLTPHWEFLATPLVTALQRRVSSRKEQSSSSCVHGCGVLVFLWDSDSDSRTYSSSSSTNFIATQVLKQNFNAAMCHVLHYSCNVNAAMAGSLHCRMICGTVPSSVRTWMPPATAATWSPAAAHSKSLPRQRGKRDRRWSCATTVEHAAYCVT